MCCTAADNKAADNKIGDGSVEVASESLDAEYIQEDKEIARLEEVYAHPPPGFTPQLKRLEFLRLEALRARKKKRVQLVAGATALAAALEKNTSVTSVNLGCARACSVARVEGWRGGGGTLGPTAAAGRAGAPDAGRESESLLRDRAPRAALSPCRRRAPRVCDRAAGVCRAFESC